MAKVKVKLSKICAANPAGRAFFIEALQAVRKTNLPAKTFYWLNKISAVVETEFAEYEKARIALVMSVGVKTESGYEVPPEKHEEFKSQLAAIDHDLELPIDEGVKLPLPANGVADDWLPLMMEMDIFAEP